MEACSFQSSASIGVRIALFAFCFSGISGDAQTRRIQQRTPEQVNQSHIGSDHAANDIPGSEGQVESAQVG